MTLTLNNTNTLTADNIVVGGTNLPDLYATINYVNTNSGGISQSTLDDSLAPFISKDIAYNNTLTSHISLIDTNAINIETNTTDISILNTKQQQNFFNISSLTHLLNTDYQTTTQLNSNFVTPSSLSTTLGNYYTSTVADSLFYNQTYVNNNIYTKTEVDGLIAGAGGGGYTDTQIDSFLSLKEDKSTFTDNVSFFPVIDLSRPSILHQGLTLKNSVVNVEPLEGVLFSNQFGAEADRNVAVFRNQTNYITLQGNKINCNATSDDSVVDLNLNPSGNVNITNDLSVSNITASGMNLSNNLSVSGETSFHNELNLFNTNANISNTSGLTFYKDTTDASNVFSVKNAQGYITFNSFNINAYNTSNDSSSLLLLNTANGNGVYCLSLGIGAIAGGNKLNVGGNSNFGGTSAFQNTSTFNGDVNINNSGRIFQRADANNSLNVISTNEINFSLQSNRASDPTTSSIAVQLNDNPAGITMNRAVTNNLTFNSIGNIVGEADIIGQNDIISWGRFMFQNSSELKEVLDGQYKLFVRNSDTLGDINLTVGLEASTPEIKLTDGKVTLLGNLEITHVDVSGSQRVLINNPDTDGFIRLSNNNLSRFDATNTGVDVYGVFTTTGSADIGGNVTCVALTETSDAKLKENIKEIDTKECYKAVKYIKPKTYNFIKDEDKKSNLGFIADDIKNAKMPSEWDNIIYYNEEGVKLLAYNKLSVVLWGCVQQVINEKDELLETVKAMKKEMVSMKGEITKLKKKLKDDD